MFKKLITGFRGKPQDFVAIDPGESICVVGDIHGCDDLLVQLLEQVNPDLRLICLGDYIDRGEHSAAVLRRLMDRPDVTVLMGNHEAMLLDFLADPTAGAAIWLRNGGLQTLSSFGIGGVSEQSSSRDLTEAADALEFAMGSEMLEWLRTLPLSCQFGNVFIAHAGADPLTSCTAQSRQSLLWGGPDNRRKQRQDDIWVVHGHWIVPEPTVSAGRIALDTGAFATGRLTAAEISIDAVRFVCVTL
ncbi:metallophosphoesterase [Phaeobacter sp. C3_T13_0]|uniref:metallophosphoesterase n=1 Tax=Phaeobacter cretensis TaxID=3342641 RepID=UPI0039BD26D3